MLIYLVVQMTSILFVPILYFQNRCVLCAYKSNVTNVASSLLHTIVVFYGQMQHGGKRLNKAPGWKTMNMSALVGGYKDKLFQHLRRVKGL